MSSTLYSVLGNGVGDYFGQCIWCFASSPSAKQCDDLAVLAAAKRDGWRVVPLLDGSHALVCPRWQCQHNRPSVPNAVKQVLAKGGAA